jgi:hypothetical protein
MSLITLSEAKTLLQISGNDKDALITMLIPAVRDFLVDYTHNRFLTERHLYSSTLTFNALAPATITDSQSQFAASYLTNAADIHVGGSLYNDGFYAVSSVTAGTITLAAGETLKSESSGSVVTTSPLITKVEFPKSLKMIVAQMLAFTLEKHTGRGIQSESIGGYSVSYAVDYPKSIMQALEPYRQIWQ